MSHYLADTVVMIRPKAFGFNPETAASNAFQKRAENLTFGEVQEVVGAEFDRFVMALRAAGVTVLVFEDAARPETPDAIFPNNWFCTLPSGQMFTFPMASKIRRGERRDDILQAITKAYGYNLNRDLEAFEGQGKALEGTGSLVMDHANKLAYAAISPRTDKEVLLRFEALSGYLVVPFRAYGPDKNPIYHTNVMMTLGPDFAIVGLDAVDPRDRAYISGVLERSGKKVLALTNSQVFEGFAGNMLCLKGKGAKKGEKSRVLVMSKAAEKSLTNAQRERILGEFGCHIVSAAIPAIEQIGGGSARCMLAEVFKPEKSR